MWSECVSEVISLQFIRVSSLCGWDRDVVLAGKSCTLAGKYACITGSCSYSNNTCVCKHALESWGLLCFEAAVLQELCRQVNLHLTVNDMVQQSIAVDSVGQQQ
jgi:hypothetical protein